MNTHRWASYCARAARWLQLFLFGFFAIWTAWMWESFSPRQWTAFRYAFCRVVATIAHDVGKPLREGDWLADRIIAFLSIHWDAWDRRIVAITHGSFMLAAILASVGLSVAIAIAGVGAKRNAGESFRRGARMSRARDLNRLTRVPRWKWWRREERERQLSLGGVAIPVEIENENFLFSGRPKMGKSLALKGMAGGIRRRGDRALVADPDGAFLACFATGDDALLNPFDERSRDWSPFAEIEFDFHHELLARAIIADGTGSDAEWRLYAQQLYAAVSRQLMMRENPTTERLTYFLTQAPPSELGKLIEGDIAAQIAAKGNEKMFSNTRAVLAMVLGSWRFLPPQGTFSVRRWVREGKGWLFLTYRDDQWAALRPLVSAWTYLAISEGLTLPPNNSRRIWYLLDELASLERIGNLEDGATKLRKHGGCLVGCVQSIAQLRDRYGANTAQSILSSLGTWLVLGSGDAETAEAMANHFGVEEIERNTLSVTRGERESSTVGRQRETRSLVLASEIRKLPQRVGYLDIAGSYPIARVSIPAVDAPERIPPFVPRQRQDMYPASRGEVRAS